MFKSTGRTRCSLFGESSSTDASLLSFLVCPFKGSRANMVAFMCRLLGRSSGSIHLINVDGTSRAAGSHERGSWKLRCSPQEPYIKCNSVYIRTNERVTAQRPLGPSQLTYINMYETGFTFRYNKYCTSNMCPKCNVIYVKSKRFLFLHRKRPGESGPVLAPLVVKQGGHVTSLMEAKILSLP